ncbi:MAG TPA: glucose-6-phosphate dehydrogenase [Actinomycetota bacterium]|nr:glucose-6-phosphate dehydrogenase [Actinomycetota bacterium]
MNDRIAILGAGGDLTARYLMPALAHLDAAGLLDEKLEIVCIDRQEWDTDAFRARIAERMPHGVPQPGVNRLCSRLSYRHADVTNPLELRNALSNGHGSIVVYLALPSDLLPQVIEGLSVAELPDESLVVIEKPFGTDLSSACRLNEMLHASFREDQVFRIDHFVHKQMVQNLLGIRFANRIFEPVWNCNHIDRVDITWDETLALEGRASYYDKAGALRDMIQNHLLQLLCLVAMEPPATLHERDLRDAKVAVLRAIPSPTDTEIAERTRRARYGPGHIDGRAVPAYVDEDGIDASRNTETLAEITLEVANWRWAGTPFRLRSGKGLGRDHAEIAVHFREVPHLAFGPGVGSCPNVLRVLFDPARLVLEMDVNGPGDPFDLEHVALDVDLHEHGLPAYSRLLLEVLQRDPTLSIRGDEAEEAWRIVEPILDAWRREVVPLEEYPAGSSG